MTDILEEIIADKRAELTAITQKSRSMKRHLAESKSGIIAEFKRKKKKKRWIHADAKAEEVVPQYAEGGASAVSILTNEKSFGGSSAFIQALRALVPELPLLRKEFIID